MSYGSISMTLKQKSILPNWSRLSLRVCRRHSQVGATSRPCWWYFYHEGVFHHEYAAPGQTVTKEYYIKVLHQLRDTARKTATVVGKRCLAALSQQCACPFFSICAGFFGKTSHRPGLSVPLQPRFGSLWLLAFHKAKIAYEREEICECDSYMYTSSVGSVSLLTD